MKKLFKLCMALLLTLAASFLFAPVVSVSTIDLFFTAVVVSTTLAVIQVRFPVNALFTSLSISELTSVLGAYFRKDKDSIFKNMLLGHNPYDNMEVWEGCKDETPMPTLNTTELIKPATLGGFTPKTNALLFGARLGKVRACQVDLQLIPAVLEKTWLGKYKQPGSDAYELPFEVFIANQIAAQIGQDIRLKALYKGVYNGSGTAAADTMDGLLTIIAAEIAAVGSIMAPVVTGVITASNALEKAILVYDGIGEAAKAVPLEMIVNSTIFDWITRKFQPVLNTALIASQQGAMANQQMINQFVLPGTNCVLKREPGFGASQRMVCSLKENLVYMTDTLNESNDITIEKEKRALNLMVDFKIGTQLKTIHPSMLAVNDQA